MEAGSQEVCGGEIPLTEIEIVYLADVKKECLQYTESTSTASSIYTGTDPIKSEPGLEEDDGVEITYTEIDIDLPNVEKECLEHSERITQETDLLTNLETHPRTKRFSRTYSRSSKKGRFQDISLPVQTSVQAEDGAEPPAVEQEAGRSEETRDAALQRVREERIKAQSAVSGLSASHQMEFLQRKWDKQVSRPLLKVAPERRTRTRIPSSKRKECPCSQEKPATLASPVPTQPTISIPVDCNPLPGPSRGVHSSQEPQYHKALSEDVALFKKEFACENQLDVNEASDLEDGASNTGDEASDIDHGASDVELEDDALCMPPEPSSSRRLDVTSPTLETLDPDMDTDLQTLKDQEDMEAMRAILPPDCYTFDWSSDVSHFHGIREAFTGTPGPTFNINEMGKPVDAFLKIFDADIVELIARETNRYADQCIAKTTFKPFARINQWSPTNKEELYIFFALLMHQNISPLTVEKDFFHSNKITSIHFFSRFMDYNRFLLLKKFLHFTDNESLSFDASLPVRRLQKIQPVLDHLSQKFESLYLPDQEISLGESLLGNNSGFIQTDKTKVEDAGIKSCELCESKTGYLLKFRIYTRKTNDQAEQTETNPDQETMTTDNLNRRTNISDAQNCPVGATAKILYDLASPLFNKGHTLIMDNFYNSPLLARCLKRNGMDCMGTLRLNQEFVPSALRSDPKNKLRDGEVVFSNCGDLSIMVWLGKSLVSMLSTFHRPEIGAPENYGTRAYKPDMVLDYDKVKGGVNRKEQLLAAFRTERLRNLIWYKKLFRRLLNVSVQNAFVLYSCKPHAENKRILYQNFRSEVMEGLLLLFSRSLIDETVRVIGTIPVRRILRPILKGNHFLVRIGTIHTRVACEWCKIMKKYKKTATKCNVCNVALCLGCMMPYHTGVLNS